MKSSRIFSGLYFFLLLCAISAFHEGTFVDKQKLKYLNIKVNGYDLKSVENITIDKNFLHFKVKTDIDTQRRPFSFQINATLHCKALYVKKIGIAFCYQDSCRHGVVSHFVKYQFQNLTDMQQLDQCAVSFDTKIDNNFGDVSIFFKKVNFLVPTSIPMKDVSFLNEIKENRKVLLPIDYASEFIVGQNETVGRAVKDVIVDNEIQRTLEPLKKENSLENAYEDWTRIFSPFVLKFYFHSYDIVPSAAGTLLKVDVPFRIELDTPSILFSFDLHPSFQGPYQCTILGKLRFPSSSTDDAWMAVLECNQDQCSTPMYSTFFYDRIKGLREGTQLNHAHVHLYVNCRDRSSSTGRPYPDVELLLQWNMYILSDIQALPPQTDIESWKNNRFYLTKQPSLFAITEITENEGQQEKVIHGTRAGPHCFENEENAEAYEGCQHFTTYLNDMSLTSFLRYLKTHSQPDPKTSTTLRLPSSPHPLDPMANQFLNAMYTLVANMTPPPSSPSSSMHLMTPNAQHLPPPRSPISIHPFSFVFLCLFIFFVVFFFFFLVVVMLFSYQVHVLVRRFKQQQRREDKDPTKNNGTNIKWSLNPKM